MKWIYYALIAMFLQGTIIFLVKTQLSNNNSYSVLFFQYFFGLIALSAYFIIKKEKINIGKKNIILSLLSGFLVSGGLITYYLGIAQSPLSVIAPIRGSGFIILTSILGVFILKERLNLRKFLGIACSIIGIIFLTI